MTLTLLHDLFHIPDTTQAAAIITTFKNPQLSIEWEL